MGKTKNMEETGEEDMTYDYDEERREEERRQIEKEYQKIVERQ